MLFARARTTRLLAVVTATLVVASTAAAVENETTNDNATHQVQESVEPRSWYQSPFAMIGFVMFAVLIVGTLIAIAARDKEM